MAESFSNFYFEVGIAEQAPSTIHFDDWMAHKFVITNDDVGQQKLYFKFNGVTPYGYLKAGESLSIHMRSHVLYLKGDTCLYRIMVFG